MWNSRSQIKRFHHLMEALDVDQVYELVLHKSIMVLSFKKESLTYVLPINPIRIVEMHTTIIIHIFPICQ